MEDKVYIVLKVYSSIPADSTNTTVNSVWKNKDSAIRRKEEIDAEGYPFRHDSYDYFWGHIVEEVVNG